MGIDWDTECFAAVHAAFGEAFLYQPVGGTAFTVTDAIFEDAYLGQAVLDGEVKAQQMDPVLAVRTSTLQGIVPAQGDIVTNMATDVSYVVKLTQPDIKGLIRLKLMATS